MTMNHTVLGVAGLFASLAMVVGCASQDPDLESEDDADVWEVDDADLEDAGLEDALDPGVEPNIWGYGTIAPGLGIGHAPFGWDFAYLPYGAHHPYGYGLNLGLECGVYGLIPTCW